MSAQRDGLKRLAKLKYQLGEQIIACGLKDEALGRACLMFAEASFECLKARDIKVHNRTTYVFTTRKGSSSQQSPEKLSPYEESQNNHAAKAMWQWDGETQFALNALDAAIDASTNPRLSVRLLSARNNLLTLTTKRRSIIMSAASQNEKKPMRPVTKGQRQQQEFIEKNGGVILAVNNGATHMFSNAESASAFQRSSKDHTTSGGMDSVYHSEGFVSYAAFCESATQNPGLWDEFNQFVSEESGTRKRVKREAQPQPE